MLWENVPGAFSSNKGRDFQTVLTECVKIAEPSAPDVPMPENGKWTKAGLLVGDGWSLAWRVLDAQYWGVPQRRRRIALVCDFGGRAAPEILFVRESVSGNFTESGTPGKEIAPGTGNSTYPTVARSLTARYDGSPCIDRGPNIVAQVIPIHDKATRYQGGGDTRHNDGAGNGLGVGKDGDPCPTLSTADRHAVFDARGNGDGQTVCTLTGDHADRVTDYTPIVARCLTANCYKQKGRADAETYLSKGGIVRRLTPLEAERLQGYPDGYTDIGDWTDANGKTHKTSDAARYKALGNSIALPPWKWVLKRIAAQYERDATLGSLFDGIGGFPFLWEQINGRGSALWVSEIAEFPAAVTRYHFGEAGHGKGKEIAYGLDTVSQREHEDLRHPGGTADSLRRKPAPE